MCGLTIGPSFGIHSHGSIAFLLPCRQLGLGSGVYRSNWHLQFRPPYHQLRIWSFWITRSIHSYHHGSRGSPHECPTLPPILEIFIGQNRNSSHTVHVELVLLVYRVYCFNGIIEHRKRIKLDRETDWEKQANVS